MRCIVFRGAGGPELMAVEERPDSQPGRFEVAIAPAYAGVNPADVLQRDGGRVARGVPARLRRDRAAGRAHVRRDAAGERRQRRRRHGGRAGRGDEVTIALRDLMSRRGHLIGTTLRTRPLEEKAQLVQQFARRIVPGLASGRLRPLVDRVFPLDEAAAALDQVRALGKLGKVLLALEDA